MERQYRLKKNRAFQYVYRRGQSAACRDLVMLHAKGRELKVGFSVSKKVGNSVVRHRIRRLIKECFRLHISEWDDRDMIVVARREAVGKSYAEIEASLLHLGKKNAVYLQQGVME